MNNYRRGIAHVRQALGEERYRILGIVNIDNIIGTTYEHAVARTKSQIGEPVSMTFALEINRKLNVNVTPSNIASFAEGLGQYYAAMGLRKTQDAERILDALAKKVGK